MTFVRPQPVRVAPSSSDRNHLPARTDRIVPPVRQRSNAERANVARTVTVDIAETGLTDIGPLQGLGALSLVGIGQNQIRSVAPIAGHTDLVLVTANANPLDCQGQAQSIAAIQNTVERNNGSFIHDCP
jgi:hypothetical protein